MAGLPKEFGTKFKQALDTIKAKTGCSLTDIKYDVGVLIGYKASTIDQILRGRLLPKLKKLELLTRALVDPKAIDSDTLLVPTGFDRRWFEEFLKCGDYPTKSRTVLLGELFPYKDRSSPLPELIILPPETPPDVDIMGRKAESVWLQNQLASKHFAIVTGMPGIGKSSFVGAFARRLDLPPQRLFWYTLRGLDGLDGIIYRLANFLAYYGDLTFLQLLHQGRQPDSMVLDQILLTMSGKGYLLCFDDFHWIRDVEIVNQIITPLLQGAKRGDFDLLIVSREIPPGVYGVDMNLLTMEGLKEEDAKHLLSKLNQSPSDEVQSILYELTQGNPQFLVFVAEILAKQQDLRGLFGEIGKKINIERFMMTEVDEHLDDEEQDVMRSLSICMEYPATYPLIEEIADQGNLRTALSNLCHRHLLLLHQGPEGTRYSQHAIVQQFYYERIPRRDRKAMHVRAAAYYSAEEQDVFKAAFHYEKAGAFEQAAEYLIGDNTLPLICQGQTLGASRLLNSIRNNISADESFQSRILLSQGTFYRTRGENESAIQAFAAGFEQANSPPEQIEFLDEMIRTYRYQGAFDKALEIIEQIQKIYESNPALPIAPKILNSMGWVYYRLGNIEQAEHYFTLASGDGEIGLVPRVRADTQLGLGIVAYSKEQLEVAIDHFTASQNLFEEIGDLIGQAHSLNNLGLVYQRQNKLDEALDALEMTLKISEDIGDTSGYIIGAYNIAIAYVQQGQYRAAHSYLQEGYPITERLQNYPLLCRYSASLSETTLHQGRLDQAKTHLDTAQMWLQKIDTDAEKGIVYYVSGAIALAEEKYAAAFETIELALPLLKKTYENEYVVLAQSVKEQAINGLSK